MGLCSMRCGGTGCRNIALGVVALGNSSSFAGNFNVAIGANAGQGMTTGACNIAIGTFAAEDMTCGQNNIIMGCKAGANWTCACQNIAIGRIAGGTGVMTHDGNACTGTNNVLIGDSAGRVLSTGGANIAIGRAAMDSATSACENIAIGDYAMAQQTMTGKCNIGIGRSASFGLTDGVFNIGIGHEAGGNGSGGRNCNINIGCGMNLTGNHQTCLGGTEVLIEGGSTFDSDCRAKCCITNLTYGLDFIKALKPRSFKWIKQADKLDEDGNILIEGDHMGRSGRTHFGLIAQEVKTVLDSLSVDTKDFAPYSDQRIGQDVGWVPSYHQHDPVTGYEKTLTLKYVEFIPMLMKAIQELSAKVDALEAG